MTNSQELLEKTNVREQLAQIHDILLVAMIPGGASLKVVDGVNFLESTIKNLDAEIKTLSAALNTAAPAVAQQTEIVLENDILATVAPIEGSK